MTITPETIENFESDCIHIAEVAVGKDGGSASGASIGTSTDRLGRVKKTLPKILEEMQNTPITMSSMQFTPISSSVAPLFGVFVDISTGKISFKDGLGVVYPLY